MKDETILMLAGGAFLLWYFTRPVTLAARPRDEGIAPPLNGMNPYYPGENAYPQSTSAPGPGGSTQPLPAGPVAPNTVPDVIAPFIEQPLPPKALPEATGPTPQYAVPERRVTTEAYLGSRVVGLSRWGI